MGMHNGALVFLFLSILLEIVVGAPCDVGDCGTTCPQRAYQYMLGARPREQNVGMFVVDVGWFPEHPLIDGAFDPLSDYYRCPQTNNVCVRQAAWSAVHKDNTDEASFHGMKVLSVIGMRTPAPPNPLPPNYVPWDNEYQGFLAAPKITYFNYFETRGVDTTYHGYNHAIDQIYLKVQAEQFERIVISCSLEIPNILENNANYLVSGLPIEQAVWNGLLWFQAAGNTNADYPPGYIARLLAVLPVGALDLKYDPLRQYSGQSVGNLLDPSLNTAPVVQGITEICSPYPKPSNIPGGETIDVTDHTPRNPNILRQFGGTSCATPTAASVAAVVHKDLRIRWNRNTVPVVNGVQRDAFPFIQDRLHLNGVTAAWLYLSGANFDRNKQLGYVSPGINENMIYSRMAGLVQDPFKWGDNMQFASHEVPDSVNEQDLWFPLFTIPKKVRTVVSAIPDQQTYICAAVWTLNRPGNPLDAHLQEKRRMPSIVVQMFEVFPKANGRTGKRQVVKLIRPNNAHSPFYKVCQLLTSEDMAYARVFALNVNLPPSISNPPANNDFSFGRVFVASFIEVAPQTTPPPNPQVPLWRFDQNFVGVALLAQDVTRLINAKLGNFNNFMTAMDTVYYPNIHHTVYSSIKNSKLPFFGGALYKLGHSYEPQQRSPYPTA